MVEELVKANVQIDERDIVRLLRILGVHKTLTDSLINVL